MFYIPDWCNVLGGFHSYPFKLLGDTIARIVSQILLMGMSVGVEWGRRARPKAKPGRGWQAKQVGVSSSNSHNIVGLFIVLHVQYLEYTVY